MASSRIKQTVLEFIDHINRHDVQRLASLMSDEHTFIDAQGNRLMGQAQLAAGWKAYFDWFPDYRIEITDIFEGSDSLVLIGFAGGSYQGKQDQSWRLPAAWRAVVKNDSVLLWQVFADTRIPFEIIERNSI